MDLGTRSRGGTRGRGSIKGGSRGKSVRRKREEGAADSLELEDVGWDSPVMPGDTDSKITFKIDPISASSVKPVHITSLASGKPFWDSLVRTVNPCSQPVTVQRILITNNFEVDELNSLLDELRQRRLDAKERALAIQIELRKLWKEKGLALERESFFSGVQKLLHEPFPVDPPLEPLRTTRNTLAKEEEAKEVLKRTEVESDDSDVPLTRVSSSNDADDDEKKKKKLRRAGALVKKKKQKVEEASDDESLTEEPKPEPTKDPSKPARTRQFWEELDQFFEYPDEESVKVLQTTSWSDDDAGKIPPCGKSKESEEDVVELGGEEEDMKKAGALPTPSNVAITKLKKSKKLALKKLCLSRSDPKIKKSIMETDRILKGESEMMASVLSQRALSAIIDVPYSTPKLHGQNSLPEPASETSPGSPKRALAKKSNPSTEERLQMELQYLGILPDDYEDADELAKEDDEICVELRALQQSLRETAAQNNRIKEETYDACALSLGSNRVLKQIKEGYKTCEKGYQKIRKKYSGASHGLLAEKKRNQIGRTLENLRVVEQETSHKHVPLFQPHPRDMHGFPRSFWNEYLASPSPYCSTLEESQSRRSLFISAPSFV